MLDAAIPSRPAEPKLASDRERKELRAGWLVLGALASIVLLQLHFALTRSINWDEFYFYGQIVDFRDGASLSPLQTLHVQLLTWIPDIVSLGVDGIVVGRLIMLACVVVSATSIALIAGRFVTRDYALATALLWLSAGFTMQHGWSFRTDPLATATMMAALAVLTRMSLNAWAIALCGLLVSLAGMFTVKTILFAPAFAGIAWLRWSEADFARSTALRISAVPAVALGLFAAFSMLHAANLGDSAKDSVAGYAGGVGGAMLFAGWPIYLQYLGKAALISLPAFLSIAATLIAMRRVPKAEAFALAGLISPLVALLIYRNTLPYFYPMMLAPVIAAAGVGFAMIAERFGLRLLILYTAVSGAIVWVVDQPSRIDQQRAIQQAAAEIFDEPVGYLDFPDMLPAHRKANGFLTLWGLQGYYDRGDGQIRELLADEEVPLLLTVEPENNATLLAVMRGEPNQRFFHPDDRNVLRNTYRPFWGPFWLAGTELSDRSSGTYEVLVPGPYTVTGDELTIDGQLFEGETVIQLERGLISLENTGQQAAGLIWGDRIQAPSTPPPARPYWVDF